MADAYGTTISNNITAKDAESAIALGDLLEQVTWGEDIQVEVDGTTVWLRGNSQYPHSYPNYAYDEQDEEVTDVHPSFFERIRGLLAPGAVFAVTSVANEKLRYNYCERLIVREDRPNEYGHQNITSDDTDNKPMQWFPIAALDESLGQCDDCPRVYDVGSQTDHCATEGKCWAHCADADTHRPTEA